MLSILARALPVLLPALWLIVTLVVLAACRAASRSDDEQRGANATRLRVVGRSAAPRAPSLR
jgi:hypothetical protein